MNINFVNYVNIFLFRLKLFIKCFQFISFLFLQKKITHNVVYIDAKILKKYDRHLFSLIKLFKLEGYDVVFNRSFYLFYRIETNSEFLHFVIKEKMVFFKTLKRTDQRIKIHLGDHNLSNDYFSFLKNNSEKNNSYHVPILQHPDMYLQDIWNKSCKNKVRFNSIIFIGNIDERIYAKIDDSIFNVISRKRIFDFVTTKNYFLTFKNKSDFFNALSTDLNKKCVIVDIQKFNLTPQEYRDMLSRFKYFLACPGVNYPLSHNLTEAISLGLVPVIQKEYNDLLFPSLKNLENAIIFNDLNDLNEKALFIFSNSNVSYEDMIENVTLYNENYMPKQIINQIFNYKNDCIYMLSGELSVKLVNQ